MQAQILVTGPAERPVFHLTNGQISYIIGITERAAIPEQLYFGPAIRPQDSYDFLIDRENRNGVLLFAQDPASSLDYLSQEYPSYGHSDFRQPALQLTYPQGDQVTLLSYVSHRILSHKDPLPGLPASFGQAPGDTAVLELQLKDAGSGVRVTLQYAVFADVAAVTRSARLEQTGPETVWIDRAMSLALDLPDHDYELIHFYGGWAHEMNLERQPLQHGIYQVSSLRGVTSAVQNPLIALARPRADEFQGQVLGFNLLYSGNFLSQTETALSGTTRVLLGIHPDLFRWELKPGQSFQTPEAVMVYSQTGLNGMSQAFHDFYRRHLIRRPAGKALSPVLLNSWEGCYFNFDQDRLVSMAKAARDMGIDLFVLDDGWFGHRDDDTTSLGDWRPDRRKLPEGISGLSRRIHALDLQFGLWIEPEMVNPGTPIWEAHPDWVIRVPGKSASPSRNQYVLDMGRPEVVDNLFDQLCRVLDDAGVDYIKWDMNRHLSELYSHALPAGRQREMSHRYCLGVYQLYERLLARYPDILFESCSSGGQRFDAGMLYYAPQAWTSDNTDAVARLKIQYGTSMGYPLAAMGAHVSAVPNHQTGRVSSLALRSTVASFGTFGYELDPARLSAAEKAQIRLDIARFKKLQPILATGCFYRLISPFDQPDFCAWMAVSKDKRQAYIAAFRLLKVMGQERVRLPLAGLDPALLYEVRGPWQSGTPRYGDNLMAAGLILAGNKHDPNRQPDGQQGDFAVYTFTLEALAQT